MEWSLGTYLSLERAHHLPLLTLPASACPSIQFASSPNSLVHIHMCSPFVQSPSNPPRPTSKLFASYLTLVGGGGDTSKGLSGTGTVRCRSESINARTVY